MGQFNNAMAGNFGSSYTEGTPATSMFRNPAITSDTSLYNAKPNDWNTTQAARSGIENRSHTSPYGSFTQRNERNVGGIDPLTGKRIEASEGLGGAWSSGEGGPQITDLSGYLGMKGQQSAGSDFSGYQARLNSLIGNQSQDRYQSQIDALLKNPSSIENTPGYQFALTQGTQAINRSAAAKGMGNSGGVLAELANYGQGMASQEYGNTINRLSNLSQAERQNQNQNINQLQNIMQGAQQFGLSSGYYNPEQYTQSLGIKSSGGGGGGSGRSAPPAPQTMQYDPRGMGGGDGYNFDADPFFQKMRARR